MRASTTAPLLLATSLFAASAASAEPAPSLPEPAIAIEGHAAIGSPVGAVGAMIDVGLLSWLSVSGGLGASVQGSHAAAMVRLRPPSPFRTTSYASGLWLGVEMGNWNQNDASYPHDWGLADTPSSDRYRIHYDRVTWVYAEPFLDIPTSSDRIRVTIHAGLAALVGTAGGDCSYLGHMQGSAGNEKGTPVSCGKALPALGTAWTMGGTQMAPHGGIAVGVVL
jgi:hypothetical protein